MKAMVIFESVYGNTEKVAQSIGAALAAVGEVQVVPVTEVKLGLLTGLDLLVVGSPTQAFVPIAGTKEFLKTLPAPGLKKSSREFCRVSCQLARANGTFALPDLNLGQVSLPRSARQRAAEKPPGKLKLTLHFPLTA